MNWIRRGRQLGLAVKNAARLREVLGVFTRHGFTDVMVRMNLDRFMPPRWQRFFEEQAEIPSEERLRVAFETLGPTFVKLGQLLASRPDLIPESYVHELLKLQDDVSTLPYDVIKKTVEEELGQSLESAYVEFSKEPIAAASIAQVHSARLHTGESVVVKIQRPGIGKIIRQDVALLEFLAKLLERYVPESRVMAPSVVVDEFFRTLHQELDFHIEANNIVRMTENLKDNPGIATPKVYKQFSKERVLTLERFEGIPLKNLDAIRASGTDLKKLNEVGARAFFKSVLIDGLFHGDMHGGNLFLLNDGRLGLIDFGIVGRLSQRARGQLSNMVLALMTEDFEMLCYQYAELGAVHTAVDFDGFQREIRNTLSPYLGLKVGDVNSGRILIEATKIATKYEIRIPGDWMLVFKAIFTAEGLGRSLDPEFDMMELGKELVRDLVKDQYSLDKISKDIIWMTKDMVSLAQVLPRQIRWFIKKWSQDGFAFEVRLPELEVLSEQLEKNNKKTSQSVLAAGLFIAGAISLNVQNTPMFGSYPAVSVITCLLGLWLWWRS